jgi:hypothetical protein
MARVEEQVFFFFEIFYFLKKKEKWRRGVGDATMVRRAPSGPSSAAFAL